MFEITVRNELGELVVDARATDVAAVAKAEKVLITIDSTIRRMASAELRKRNAFSPAPVIRATVASAF